MPKQEHAPSPISPYAPCERYRSPSKGGPLGGQEVPVERLQVQWPGAQHRVSIRTSRGAAIWSKHEDANENIINMPNESQCRTRIKQVNRAMRDYGALRGMLVQVDDMSGVTPSSTRTCKWTGRCVINALKTDMKILGKLPLLQILFFDYGSFNARKYLDYSNQQDLTLLDVLKI